MNNLWARIFHLAAREAAEKGSGEPAEEEEDEDEEEGDEDNSESTELVPQEQDGQESSEEEDDEEVEWKRLQSKGEITFPPFEIYYNDLNRL